MSISLKEATPLLADKEAVVQMHTCAQFSLLLDYKGTLWFRNEEMAAKLKKIYADESERVTCFDVCVQKPAAELVALGFESGAVEFINLSGSSQKKIKDAHKGSVIAIAFSPDFQTILSSSEDCSLKLWSRSGMLRSEFSKVEVPSYAIAWSPDSSQVAYGNGKELVFKNIRPGTQDLTVKSTEVGVILVLSWSKTENLVLATGEDCRYNIYDGAGHSRFVSSVFDAPFTCGIWSSLSGIFVLSSFCELMLGDKTGKLLHRLPLKVPTLTFCLASDSNKIAVGLENGSIQVGVAILYTNFKYKNFELKSLNENNILVSDIHSDYTAKLDFGAAAVTSIGALHDRVLVTAGWKCHLYDTKNFITPIIFEIPNELLLFSAIAPGFVCFALSSAQTKLLLYDFHGKQTVSLKLPFQSINQRLFAASWETIACVDAANPRVVQFFDAKTGRELSVFRHTNDITQVALNFSKDQKTRKLAIMDVNKDLHIFFIGSGNCRKVSSMTVSFLWNESLDVLAYSATQRVSVLYSPDSLLYDTKLSAHSTVSEQMLGKCELTEFNDCQLCSNAERNVSLVHQVNGFAFRLLKTINEGTSAEVTTQTCIRLARFFKSNLVWAILAVHALEGKDTDTSELALAALQEIDKVQYLAKINAIEDKDAAQFEFLRFMRRFDECEKHYLSRGKHLEAVKLYTLMFDFEKALTLARQIKATSPELEWLGDYVLHKRRKYLEGAGFTEDTNEFFRNLRPKCSPEEVRQRKAKLQH
jgi:intraflagellar transport protein 80